MNTLLISLLSYLLLLIFLVFYLNKKQQSVESYFLNQRTTHLGVMTMSLVTTILGTGATVVVISEVYNSGISYGLAFLISSITGLVVLAACARQIKTYGDIYKATTISDFFGRRFNKKVKAVTAILLLLVVLIMTAIQLTAVSIMLTTAFNMPYWAALFLVGSIRLLYTTVGGFRFGLFTDLINGWILLFVLVFVAVMGLIFLGQHPGAILPPSFDNPIAYGGFWWFAGTIVLAGFAQVANASQWQRIMSADNVKTVENSFKLAIPLVILLGSIIAFLGILAYKLNPGLTPEHALFSLIETVLPSWFSGIVFATMIAVFTTALDNQIIAGSAVVFGLLYQRHDLTHKESILNARLITAILSIIGFLLALMHPTLVRFSSFSTHIALIIGPVLVATLFTSNKKSSEAVLWSLIIPFVLLCILYPVMKSATFVVTTPLTLLILKYYDKWTAPRHRVYK